MKTYPFSVKKHAHSIELYYTHFKNELYDIENSTDTDKFNLMYDFMERELLPLYMKMFDSTDGSVVYLTGSQISLAKKIVVWASERRAEALISAGKFDFLEYC